MSDRVGAGVRISDPIRWTISDGVAVLVDLEHDTYYTLNPCGTRVWEVIASGGDEASAVEAICTQYGVTRPIVERDVAALIHKLVEGHLLCVSS